MTPFGDEALRFDVPGAISARRQLLERLRGVPGVRDVVLAETVGAVVFAPGADRALVERALALPLGVDDAVAAGEHRVQVVYDGEDLAALPGDIVALHTGAEYTVSMLGFLPGFAYLRGLPDALKLPRRAPRPRVPAYSVAIGAEYTGIYPVASAGGWHLLGRALDVPRFELGDRVRFEAVDDLAEQTPRQVPELPVATGPHVTVTRCAGLALFVDGGRPGQMHVGMPTGGPLVRATFDAANAEVGNAPGACAIEVTGQLELEVDGISISIASGPGRVAYVVVEGGFDALVISGGRGALLAAGIGRPLRRGDTIGVTSTKLACATAGNIAGMNAPVRLRPGPDATPEILREICSAEFQISSTSDRAGTRLVGSELTKEEVQSRSGQRPSMPMVEGAIELTPSGLVVLGPDHPTTGGYPVVAVVAAASRDAFFARPLGARVRFVEA